MSVDRSALPRVGADPRFRFPAIERVVVDDGLRVWSVAHREMPVVALSAIVPSGSAADPPGLEGLTGLTTDLLDEATVNRSAFELHDGLARLGADLDSETSSDVTMMSLLTLRRHAEPALVLLEELLSTPRFDQADFERVRDLRLSRVRQMRDVPSAVADRALTHVLFGDGPYGHTVFGSEASLGRITLDDVRRHHRAAYLETRLDVVVVGDMSADEAAELVRRVVGGRRARGNVASVVAPPPTAMPTRSRSRRCVLVNRPGAAQSELRLGRVAAARSTPDYFPLLVANAALGGQFVSRINLNLREAKGYTYGARSGVDFRRMPGPFAVGTSVQTDATGDAIREILKEIDEIGGSRPASDEELRRARASLTRGYPRGFETAEQIARGVAMVAIHGLPFDHFDRFAERVAAVDAAEATRVAREYFVPAEMDVVIVGDRAAVDGPVEALGLGSREYLDAHEV
ncbi:MAG: pitrilysin family protein [Vicinamibacterales bacterium]